MATDIPTSSSGRRNRSRMERDLNLPLRTLVPALPTNSSGPTELDLLALLNSPPPPPVPDTPTTSSGPIELDLLAQLNSPLPPPVPDTPATRSGPIELHDLELSLTLPPDPPPVPDSPTKSGSPSELDDLDLSSALRPVAPPVPDSPTNRSELTKLLRLERSSARPPVWPPVPDSPTNSSGRHNRSWFEDIEEPDDDDIVEDIRPLLGKRLTRLYNEMLLEQGIKLPEGPPLRSQIYYRRRIHSTQGVGNYQSAILRMLPFNR